MGMTADPEPRSIHIPGDAGKMGWCRDVILSYPCTSGYDKYQYKGRENYKIFLQYMLYSNLTTRPHTTAVGLNRF